jgi:hypothetical protein
VSESEKRDPPPDQPTRRLPERPERAPTPKAPPAGAPVPPQVPGQQPYGYGYGYPPEGYQGPYVQRKTNGFAVASLVLGIVWVYWIGSILALIFGMVAKSQIDQSGGWQQGRGMATAGIVLGWVGIGFLLLWILFFGLAGCGALVSSS